MLGQWTIGAFALGQSPSTITVLLAGVGSFTLTGEPATSSTKMAVAAGSFLFTGIAAAFSVQHAVVTGNFVLTGILAAFQIQQAIGRGAFTLVGNPATPRVALTYSPSGELMISRWENTTVTLAAENRVMFAPADTDNRFVSPDRDPLKPIRRTLEPGQ